MRMFEWLSGIFGGGKAPVLTREMIGTLPPAKLYRKVLYTLPDADDANDAQRDFVSMILLDGEVCNGGFNQYYYNTAEERQAAERAFAAAGAADAAELVRRANACFEANRERLKTLWDGTMKGFSKSYKEKLFDTFDTEYYALMKGGRFHSLIADFVRSRAEDFITEK